MDKYTSRLFEIIDGSDNIVFFGGAGVSTESGIPDFRSATGVFNMKQKYPAEMILSHSFFKSSPVEFYKFYRDVLLHPGALPNDAHLALSHLEKLGKLKAVITQNVDGLHQAAGSKKVLELHGSAHRNYCQKCKKIYDMDYIINNKPLPLCKCGGLIKPDVVLYEEPLDDGVVSESIRFIADADVLIIGGTSLNVYPAAGLVRYFSGRELVLINKSETMEDHAATLCINDPIGKVLAPYIRLQ